MAIPWDAIKIDMHAGMTMTDVARKYDVKYDTVKKYVKRHPEMKDAELDEQLTAEAAAANKDALAKTVKSEIVKLVENWPEKAELTRAVAFEKAHESIKLFVPKAPKSFRELEAADKIARRAAGLETADVIQQTLINLNEAIDGYEVTEMRPAIPAEVVESQPSEIPDASEQEHEPAVATQ